MCISVFTFFTYVSFIIHAILSAALISWSTPLYNTVCPSISKIHFPFFSVSVKLSEFCYFKFNCYFLLLAIQTSYIPCAYILYFILFPLFHLSVPLLFCVASAILSFWLCGSLISFSEPCIPFLNLFSCVHQVNRLSLINNLQNRIFTFSLTYFIIWIVL